MLSRLSRIGPSLYRARLSSVLGTRFVSQTPKTNSTESSIAADLRPYQPPSLDRHGDSEVNPYDKNPDFCGFDPNDPVADRWTMHIIFFVSISLVCVCGFTFIYFLPERGYRHWARREAEARIVEREAAGLPVIYKDYYDPSSIILPPPDKK